MTVKQIVETLNLNVFSLTDEEREVTGAYIGDLLSWVMGRANADNAWITIMSNINIIAVASLADVACIILSEGVTVDDQIIETAKQKEINIISSQLPSYETSVKVSEMI